MTICPEEGFMLLPISPIRTCHLDIMIRECLSQRNFLSFFLDKLLPWTKQHPNPRKQAWFFVVFFFVCFCLDLFNQCPPKPPSRLWCSCKLAYLVWCCWTLFQSSPLLSPASGYAHRGFSPLPWYPHPLRPLAQPSRPQWRDPTAGFALGRRGGRESRPHLVVTVTFWSGQSGSRDTIPLSPVAW